MISAKILAISVGVAVAATANGTCPITECNYQDPQYNAAFAAYRNCVGAVVDQFEHAMDALAILYPRFGTAWNAYNVDLHAAVADIANPQSTDDARRRFEDRILRTAETDALQIYNLWQVKIKRGVDQCGRMPEPPRLP